MDKIGTLQTYKQQILLHKKLYRTLLKTKNTENKIYIVKIKLQTKKKLLK